MPDHLAFIGVGSNIAPEENIPRGLEILASRARLEAVSMFYRTAALERPDAPDFLNGVVRLRTDLDASSLKFEVLRTIEAECGRTRSLDAYGSRTLDLDILLFDSSVISAPGLRVPDPDIRERSFVAAPLLELAPDIVLPDTGEKLSESPRALSRDGLVPEIAFTRALRERLHL